ncbi:hypothetical protein [Nannocystis punicea]|uniref:Uncharacterized protein n=1 Tax=Nannocystis punicea TaxID=2995304 RepID=A0ABY7HBA4_9BACT|nr:hypothetical protein [Nannocystis poenicansa]WAS96555.1 hypothetical protein O0S08_10390 [Nannocystis poenicansa]
MGAAAEFFQFSIRQDRILGPAEQDYADCEALLEPQATASPDLLATFLRLNRAIARFVEIRPWWGRTPHASCTAVQVVGGRLSGAHAGGGCALLVPASGPVERLAIRDTLAMYMARLDPDIAASMPDLDQSPLQDIGVNALGLVDLRAPSLAIQTFARDISAGDVVLLCSRELPLADDVVAAIVGRARASSGSLDECVAALTRALRQASDEAQLQFAVALGVVRAASA